MWNTPPSPPAPDQAPSPASAQMEGGLQLGVPMTPHTVARLVLYLQELVRWNAKVNLTGLAEEADIIPKHFLDSLAACKVLKVGPGLIQPGPGRRVLDVGTGAGFPGLVLKLYDPELAVTLLEPSQKKAAFLHHMIGLLGVTGVSVVIVRIQDLKPAQAGPFDPLQLEWVVPSWAPRRARAPTGESAGLRRRKAPRDGAARRQDPLHEQRVPRLRWAMQGQDPHKEQRVPRRW